MEMYVVVERDTVALLGIYADIDEAIYEAEHLDGIVCFWKKINGKFALWEVIE